MSEGTVKSRLNYARKAIKAGVDEHEKQGVKLYGFSLLPFLSYFLRAGSESVCSPFTIATPGAGAAKAASSVASTGAETPAAAAGKPAGHHTSAGGAVPPRASQTAGHASAAGAKAGVAAAGTAAKAAAASGFGAFLSTAIGKIVAVVVIALVLSGVAIGTVLALKGGQEDVPAQQVMAQLPLESGDPAAQGDDIPAEDLPTEPDDDPAEDLPTEPAPDAEPEPST